MDKELNETINSKPLFETPNIISGQSFNGAMSQKEKDARFELAKQKYGEFLEACGYDWKNDPNMNDTPRRYTKVIMNEIGKGTYLPAPKITVFENQQNYKGIVLVANTRVKSLCSHHMAFIQGYAHIAYIPGNKVIGISKISRIVDWVCRRPQLQEQMTSQIIDEIEKLLPDCTGVACVIEAQHTCMTMRGVEETQSCTTTSKMTGSFLMNPAARNEFFDLLERQKHNI